jgi:serine/threonine-protein kinase
MDESNQPVADELAAILADYLTRADGGEPVDRETLIAKHPEYHDALQDYFADVDLVERLATGSANGDAAAVPALPREFGEYSLRKEIGRGGMGIVYKAREHTTGRLVALKMLLHGLFLSRADVLRFRNEAKTAAGLEHRGIVPIYHVGEHDGLLFYTMPLVKGINLAQRSQSLRRKSTCSIGLPCLTATVPPSAVTGTKPSARSNVRSLLHPTK